MILLTLQLLCICDNANKHILSIQPAALSDCFMYIYRVSLPVKFVKRHTKYTLPPCYMSQRHHDRIVKNITSHNATNNTLEPPNITYCESDSKQESWLLNDVLRTAQCLFLLNIEFNYMLNTLVRN